MKKYEQHLSDWQERATVSVTEAGQILGIGRSSAFQAASNGDLPVIRIGKRLLVSVAGLQRMLGIGGQSGVEG